LQQQGARAEAAEKRIADALVIAGNYGQIDGDHHKMWTIDQMVRALLAAGYAAWVQESCSGEDGPETYEWDTGIAP